MSLSDNYSFNRLLLYIGWILSKNKTMENIKKLLNDIRTNIVVALTTLILLNACAPVKVPDYATPVTNFDINKYVGKWYEIARLDFKHEKDLNNVTAEYILQEDGSVKVLNRGYNYKKNNWEEAKGKAKFLGGTSLGALKVSFFGPFYAGYNVVALDEDYNYALVFGQKTAYMWILSREKTIPDSIRTRYVEKAKAAGYNVENLVWTEHD